MLELKKWVDRTPSPSPCRIFSFQITDRSNAIVKEFATFLSISLEIFSGSENDEITMATEKHSIHLGCFGKQDNWQDTQTKDILSFIHSAVYPIQQSLFFIMQGEFK